MCLGAADMPSHPGVAWISKWAQCEYNELRCWLCLLLQSKSLKGGIGSLFDPCVNAIGQRPHCSSLIEMSYCTFGFAHIVVLNAWFTARWPICMCDLSPSSKGSSGFCLVGLATKKPEVQLLASICDDKMAATTDSLIKFLGYNSECKRYGRLNFIPLCQ